MEADPFHKNQFFTEQTPKQFQGFETQFAKTNHNTGNPFHQKALAQMGRYQNQHKVEDRRNISEMRDIGMSGMGTDLSEKQQK